MQQTLKKLKSRRRKRRNVSLFLGESAAPCSRLYSGGIARPSRPYSDLCFSPHSLHLNSPRCCPAEMITRFGTPHFAHLTSLRLSSCLTVSLRSIASFIAASDWARSSFLVSVTCFLYVIITPDELGRNPITPGRSPPIRVLEHAPGGKPTQRKIIDVRFGVTSRHDRGWGPSSPNLLRPRTEERQRRCGRMVLS